MQSGVDQRIVSISGKSRIWILGFIMFFMNILSSAGLIFGLMYLRLDVYIPCNFVFSFSIVIYIQLSRKRYNSTVTINKNAKILKIVNVRNIIQRTLWNMHKKQIQRFQFEDIRKIEMAKSLFHYKLVIYLHNNVICSSGNVFKADQLQPFLEIARRVIQDSNREAEVIQPVHIPPLPQIQPVILIQVQQTLEQPIQLDLEQQMHLSQEPQFQQTPVHQTQQILYPQIQPNQILKVQPNIGPQMQQEGSSQQQQIENQVQLNQQKLNNLQIPEIFE